MTKLSVYDMIVLQQYFANKKKPTARDKTCAKKLDDCLADAVEGMISFRSAPVQP